MTKIKPSVMRLTMRLKPLPSSKGSRNFQTRSVYELCPEGLAEVVAIEERILLQICEKYGAEDMGSDYGEKWWQKRIDFFILAT